MPGSGKFIFLSELFGFNKPGPSARSLALHGKKMNLLGKIKLARKNLAGYFYSRFPFPGIANPIFIIGCGRSGTTIFGETLAQHKAITYLNEPRHLWFSAYPETDIWSAKAARRKGQMYLSESNVKKRNSRILSRLLRFETIMSGKPVLVEKLPINNFRLKFIHQMFPDAYYIHIYRNGLEVARSIEKLSQEGKWFGRNSYKWNRLVEYAALNRNTRDLPQKCESFLEKGLLEWRLSTEAAVEFIQSLDDDTCFEVSYDEFMHNPVKAISQVISFIGIDADHNVEQFAASAMARKSSRLNEDSISEQLQIIGGKLLPLSMDNEQGLTKRCTGRA